MFFSQDIKARLLEKPFRPFRIVATEGLRFEVRHPDMVFVGQHDLMVGTPWKKFPGIYESVTRVALVHIVALEDLEPALAPGNGQLES